MDYVTLIGISLGLAMDAFAVSITNGATIKDINMRFAFKEAFMFGLFQAVMPVLGWMIGKAGENFISTAGNYISFGLLSFIGGKMIYDCLSQNDLDAEDLFQRKRDLSWRVLLLMSIATSIDALATGVILPVCVGAYNVYKIMIAVLIIGGITFIVSFFGVFIGKLIFSFHRSNQSRYLNLLGGLILIGIGLKILLGY